ncbi:hypothetical protein D3C78_1150740 [compost metagenome]
MGLFNNDGRQPFLLQNHFLNNVVDCEQQQFKVSLFVARILQQINLKRKDNHMIPGGQPVQQAE